MHGGSATARRLVGLAGLSVVATVTIAPLTMASASVSPNDGIQPIQVGVQIKTGAFVPAGTTTAETEATITETGPNADGSEVTTCDTDGATEDPGSTASYCTFAVLQHRSSARADDIPIDELYFAAPGDTVTVTQTTVNAGLVIDSSTKTFGPCQLAPDEDFCSDQTALFNDPGIPPTASNDSGSVNSGGSVVIDVTANDTSHGAPTTIAIDTSPSHGTATPVPSSDSAVSPARAEAGVAASSIRYTPDTGFSGHDTFTYTLSDANGSATASVALTVSAAPKAAKAPAAVNDSASTTSGQSVTIDVLGNDDPAGSGALHLRSVGDPSHGTATIDGATIVYRPAPGFSGVDHFSYTAANSGGRASARVTVTVAAPPVSPPPPAPAILPNTGAPVALMIDEALILVAAGSLLAATARRRRPRGGSTT
ncbi:MAG TPA: Ig-like domain-containing protein [Mycobacteriales bacterium]|nr:Ig-like domain-containing protein [Mycobacteriales bacterium]